MTGNLKFKKILQFCLAGCTARVENVGVRLIAYGS